MAVVARSLAVSVMPLENRREQFLTLATLCERLGYDALLLPETWAYDVTIVLAEAAVKTERVRVGSAILGVWNRSAGDPPGARRLSDDPRLGRRRRRQGARGRRVARVVLSDVDGDVLPRHADPLRVRQGSARGARRQRAEVRGRGAAGGRGVARRADRLRHAGRGATPPGALVRGRRRYAWAGGQLQSVVCGWAL